MAKSFTRPSTAAAAGSNPAFAPAPASRLSPSVQSTPPKPLIAPGAPAHEDIARAAYFRWQRHGGSSEENWRAAERELRQQRTS